MNPVLFAMLLVKLSECVFVCVCVGACVPMCDCACACCCGSPIYAVAVTAAVMRSELHSIICPYLTHARVWPSDGLNQRGDLWATAS